MASATNVVSEAADLLRARISELDSERAKLERALASLTEGREGKRGPGRPRGGGGSSRSRSRSSSTSGSGKKRRRRRGGTRAEQAVKLITKKPGMGASEIARELGIKPNYMYRVLTELQSEGKVKKEGRAYHPAG